MNVCNYTGIRLVGIGENDNRKLVIHKTFKYRAEPNISATPCRG